ncbi:MAG: YlmH/Sll1252 family protein [Clostridium sp.]
MNKQEFIKFFKEFDESLIYKLYDKILLTQKTSKETYLKFFVYKEIYNKLKKIENSIGVKICCNGIFEEAERVMISISVYDSERYYPMDLLKITNRSKFNNLTHKDYLGAIMAQGIKRELLGDLVVKEDACYVPIVEDITKVLELGLDFIGKCPCEITKLDYGDLDNIPKASYEEKLIIVTAFRIDNIVSGICNISRNKGLELIQSGKVLVNYTQVDRKDKIINNSDIITIRGYGKFKIGDVVSKTNSERFKILVKKYV